MALESVGRVAMAAMVLVAVATPAGADGAVGPPDARAYVGASGLAEAIGLEAEDFCWSFEHGRLNQSSDACWRAGGQRAGLPDLIQLVRGIVFGVVLLGQEVCVMVEGGSVQGCTAMCVRGAPLLWCGGETWGPTLP